jgi:ribonuclease BN (tRNA processing enzyme)
VQLTVAGCSPAWPDPGGAQSGYLLEAGGNALLLDCGPGVLARLRTAVRWPDPDAIVITHFHLDHWGDLVPWVWGALHLRGRGRELRKPVLWVPPGGRARLEQFGGLLGFSDMFERVFTPLEYAPGVAFDAGGCTVTATAVPHYTVEAYALRVAGAGRTLAYSGDSGPSDQLASVAREADLFLCEATLLAGDADGEPRGHLSLEEAHAAFEASAAKELLITHRPCELDKPDAFEFARDGLVRDV